MIIGYLPIVLASRPRPTWISRSPYAGLRPTWISRSPHAGLRCCRLRSNAALLSAVCAPFTLKGPYTHNTPPTTRWAPAAEREGRRNGQASRGRGQCFFSGNTSPFVIV